MKLSNVNGCLYPDRDVDLSGGGALPVMPKDGGGDEKPQWWHYFLCGIKGVLQVQTEATPKGFNAVVDGKIPPSAGLSSSSALVVSAALCKF